MSAQQPETFGDWNSHVRITGEEPYPMASARAGVVEFNLFDGWSGRLTPTAARAQIDALHAAVHAAADAAEDVR